MACSDDLLAFVRLCDRSPELQGRVSRCEQPGQLLELISSEGLEISLKELMAYSGELNTDYWPWITPLGRSSRNAFFSLRP
ncbi:MAG: hypothetical protein HQ469_08890 [Cyanobacteria bacterium]|nr:hypothetical protein [Cyanobacteria bacterium bin.275]